MSASDLYDGFGRTFPYLRLSVTDVCNFRCQYCLPHGYQKPQCNGANKNNLSEFLSVEEITNLVAAFVTTGLQKVRITGGEPTVRKDFDDIARTLTRWPQITRRTFTTNGYKLAKNAKYWLECGLNAVNVSVDSLDATTFHALTGHDKLNEVLAGIDAAIECGYETVKVNAVLHRTLHENHQLDQFLDYARSRPIGMRFIELMETGDNRDYFKRHHLSSAFVVDRLLACGWSENPRDLLAGPARVFSHPEFQGEIGIIAPYSKDFCATCNRLRVTAKGDLRLCLFGEFGIPLRPMLQSADQHDDLVAAVRSQLLRKTISHRLQDGNVGITPHMASIGG